MLLVVKVNLVGSRTIAVGAAITAGREHTR
jgi:hypothetical protein